MTTLSADWLEAQTTRAVMQALGADRGDTARFVGGCVRNTMMGRPVDDIDIATVLTPQAVLTALEQTGIRAIPTGIEHGTITAIIEHQPFEITTLRKDVETDGRRAIVAFTTDWREDAERRDFRLNALYAGLDGKVYDPTGGGLDDAKAGRVIFIGDADERLREDYLRILRFFRFNAWYGAEIDPDGLSACARQKQGLQKIARERIWKELKKLFAAETPRVAIEAMQEAGILDVVLPEYHGCDGLHDLELTETLTGTAPDPMLRLMALLPRSALAVQQTRAHLRLSNDEAGRLTMWAAENLPDTVGMNGRQLRAALYWHGVQAVTDRAMLSGQDVRDLLAASRAWREPVLPVNGQDAKAAGFTGPEIGQALSRAASIWVESDFTLERDALLLELKRPLN